MNDNIIMIIISEAGYTCSTLSYLCHYYDSITITYQTIILCILELTMNNFFVVILLLVCYNYCIQNSLSVDIIIIYILYTQPTANAALHQCLWIMKY